MRPGSGADHYPRVLSARNAATASRTAAKTGVRSALDPVAFAAIARAAVRASAPPRGGGRSCYATWTRRAASLPAARIATAQQIASAAAPAIPAPRPTYPDMSPINGG